MTRDPWRDMVGAYVLDALGPDDRVAFEARMNQDGELRLLVDEARESMLVLAESIPAVEPPSALRERILERARESRPSAGSATGGAATGGAATGGGDPGDVASPGQDEGSERPRPSPDVGGRQAHDRGRREVDADGGRDDHEGDGHRSAPGPSARPLRAVAPWILLAASVAGLLWLGRENVELRNQSDGLSTQLESARASLTETEAALAGFDSLALALTGPNVQLATLTGDAEPNLRLVWNRDRDLLLVAAQGLPAVEPGRTFQLWGIRGSDAPVSLGTFDTDAAGSALLTLAASAAVDFDVSAITDEPAGGSPQPTTTPFLVGAWTAAQ